MAVFPARNQAARTVGPYQKGTIIAAAGALAVVTASLVAIAGARALAGVLASVVFIVIVIRPQLGAYLYLIASPLIVGFGRGDVFPIIRPNEALLILIVIAVSTRVVLRVLSGKRYRVKLTCLDAAIVLLAVASSVFPLLLRYGRGLPVSSDDLLYAIVLWKYTLVYYIFRGSITQPSQVMVCLWLSMASATVVAVVAILQVSSLLGVPELLNAYYDAPFEGYRGPVTTRGTSTIASSFGLADVMIINLVIAITLLRAKKGSPVFVLAAAGLFLAGGIVAGSFSGFIGLAVAVLALGILIGRLQWILGIFVPAAAVASATFWPVIAQKLSGFQSPAGVPHSWKGRWENLQEFFFPELFSGLNWLVGIRPAPRLPAPEAWRDYVYIESGYVWLLWIGGLPLLAAFGFFVWVWLRCLWRVTRERTDVIAVAAAAGFAYLVVLTTLMLFDPHLTGRGSADLFFPLLALSLAHLRFACSDREVWTGRVREVGAGIVKRPQKVDSSEDSRRDVAAASGRRVGPGIAQLRQIANCRPCD
jgi:hypothetical protein